MKGRARTALPGRGITLLVLLSLLVLGSIGPWAATAAWADAPPSSPTPQPQRGPAGDGAGATPAPSPPPYYYSPGGVGGPEDVPVVGQVAGFFSDLPKISEGIDKLSRCLADAPQCAMDFLAGLINLAMKPFLEPVTFILFSVISKTGKDITVDAPPVQHLMGITRLLSLSLLAVMLMWGGFALMMNRHLAVPYHELAELLPRAAAAVALIAIFPWLASFLIDVNNALVGAVLHPDEMRNTWDEMWQRSGAAGPLVAFWVAALVIGVVLAGQLLLRFVLLDILLVLAPVAIILWILPQTRKWHELWATLFPATVFQQAIQAWVLVIGFRLLDTVWVGTSESGGWLLGWPLLASVFTAIAVMLAALKVPGLLAHAFGWGYPQYNAIFTTIRSLGSGGGRAAGPRPAPAGGPKA